MQQPLSFAQKKFIEKYAEQGWTSPAIAEHLGVSVRVVRKWRPLVKKGFLLIQWDAPNVEH